MLLLNYFLKCNLSTQKEKKTQLSLTPYKRPWLHSLHYSGKTADGKEREDFDVNTAPTWAWADLEGWTGQEIHQMERLEPDLQLESSHLGRGREFYDLEVCAF